MHSIRGKFEDGVARSAEPVSRCAGQAVIITFHEEPATGRPLSEDEGWETFERLIDDLGVETGVPDLAHRHDHYLYGKPKQEG